jgi:hypothetical protein
MSNATLVTHQIPNPSFLQKLCISRDQIAHDFLSKANRSQAWELIFKKTQLIIPFPLDLSHWKLDKEKKDIEHCIISPSNP